MGRGPRWTEEERDLLRAEYSPGGVSELARRLGRTHRAVTGQAHAMGLARRNRAWTRPEVQRLMALRAQGLTFREIAQILGRTLNSCSARWRSP